MIFKINEFISYKILTSWPHTKIVGPSSSRRLLSSRMRKQEMVYVFHTETDPTSRFIGGL